jgi:peptidoglycan/xylan/chitin deacetylase (PgdA/CDA1 family)/glycosyltransferase involved in cell wall biosynthesis/SAM-dependent methyltransferase
MGGSMSRTPIAAIVTCHDLGRTLREALDSVERQTRPATEIVVVDDRSTDLYTRQVLAELRREGTHVLEIAGGSASAARNAGARRTEAPYLVWLDADDVLEPTYFELAAARLDAEPGLDFVTCALQAFGAAEYMWRPSPPTFVQAVSTGGVPHASSMIRRCTWAEVGGFDESLPTFELLDFWASVLERGGGGVVLDEPLLRYRIRGTSGYRRSLRSDTYLARLRHFYEKHDAAVRRHSSALIEGKEAFILSQLEYQRLLEARVAETEKRLRATQHQIAVAVRRLAEHGVPRVERGEFGRSIPISPSWGRDRGTPIDRYYIERFLGSHREDIRGRVLEVRDSTYTTRFGGSAVTHSDVVDIDASNGRASVVADLRDAANIASETYDCIVITQTLHLVDDIASAIRECARLLRPGGVVLATAPGIIRVDDEAGLDGDHWRLTEASARRLFAEAFPIERVDVTTYGNVGVAAAFLYGLSVEELPAAELNPRDPAYPMVVAIRAVRTPLASSDSDRGAPAVRTTSSSHAAILVYHRIAELSPDTHELCTPPAVFEEQMACLARYCTPISLEELTRAAACDRIPERAVVVTLDDGYLDALTTASPILQACGVPATFFVNSDRLAEPHERWWDIMERLFLTSGTLPPLLDVQGDGYHVRVETANPAQRSAALERVNEAAWALDANGRASLASRVLAWSGLDFDTRESHRVLTCDELRTLASRPGHSIGAHTVHHLALTTQPREARHAEVASDKAALDHILGRPVPLFSYPYGDFDAELVTVVRDAGFRAAVTVEAGRVSCTTNRLLMPRYEVTREMRAGFAERIQSIWQM